MPVNTSEMECSPLEERPGDQGVGGPDEGAEDSGEAQALRRVPQPRLLSVAERGVHERTHCPARPWSKNCVYGAAAEYPHRTVVGKPASGSFPG